MTFNELGLNELLLKAIETSGYTTPSDVQMQAIPAALSGASGLIRRAQNGFVRSYALTMLLGVVAILGAVWVMQ